MRGSYYQIRLAAAVFAAGLASAGCGRSTTSAPDAALEDAGQPPADAGQPRAVTIQLWADSVAADGTVSSVPYTWDVEVLVPGPTGLTSLYANPAASGDVEVADVPHGEYLLRAGGTYVVTSADAVDLGYSVFGRPGVPVARTSPTNLTINASSMLSWSEDDSLALAWPVTGGGMVFELQWFASGGVPSAGATSLAGLTIDLAPWGAPLIDTTNGDRAVLLHLSQRMATEGHPYKALTETAELAPLTLRDGEPATASGDLADLTLDRSLTVDIRGTEFASLLAQAGADVGEQFPLTLNVVTLPQLSERGTYDAQPDLLSIEVAANTDVNDTFSYANPFAPWDELAVVTYTYGRDHALAGASPSVRYGSYWAEMPVAQAASDVIRPSWTPPQEVRVNGEDAAQDVDGVGLTPLVTWSPPSRGTPDAYSVQIYQLGVSAGRTTQTFIAALHTRGTSVRVPEGVLASDQAYVFVVDARFGRSAEAPFREPVPGGAVSFLTGILRP